MTQQDLLGCLPPQERIEKSAEIFGQLFGDDVFVQLLPNTFCIALIGLDHAVDWAVNWFGKELPDFHIYCPIWNARQDTSRNAR